MIHCSNCICWCIIFIMLSSELTYLSVILKASLSIRSEKYRCQCLYAILLHVFGNYLCISIPFHIDPYVSVTYIHVVCYLIDSIFVLCFIRNDDADVEDYGNKWSLGAMLWYLKSNVKDSVQNKCFDLIPILLLCMTSNISNLY